MKIVFFSNYLNHHQLPLAEAFNSIDGIDYTFVSISGLPEFRKELGYKEISAPFMLDVTKSEANRQQAKELALKADIAIFSTSRTKEYIVPRLKSGKLTFEYSERWFKKDYKLNILSKNLWMHQVMYYKDGRKANLYMLCASAYAPNDYYLLNSYKGRCFKWAYFTCVKPIDIDAVLRNKQSGMFRMMWCSRFIGWKHPELVIDLANTLKTHNYAFEINMYGGGPQELKIRHLIKERGLDNFVYLKGSMPNEDIIAAMQQHNVLLFTSDQNEGWGAVANEAMSNGCTLVGSNKIGSVPFLVRHGENGLIFESSDISSLIKNVTLLLENRDFCGRLASQAYQDMINIWNPQIAAKRFLSLVSSLQAGEKTPFTDGPCSEAKPI